MSPTSGPERPAVLFVAHPGHELRIHAWLGRARPRVLVLTDGAGRTGLSRVASTRRVLDAAGAAPGGLFGRFSDAALYRALLGGETQIFLETAEKVAAELVAVDAGLLVADACEGYNPAHDLCRMMADAAIAIAAHALGREIPSYDFLLVGPPDACPEELEARAMKLTLDDAEAARKEVAAWTYPELAGEVDIALRRSQATAFRTEVLRPADARRGGVPPELPPYYETYGEGQVAAGHYRDVIRWRDHLLPVARALETRAGITLTSGAPCAS